MRVLFLLLTIVLTSCTSPAIKQYKNEEPKLDLKTFFNGNIYALGIVQNRSGEVIQRFKVDIKASWDGNTATLDEKFDYSDGSKSKRVWTLVQKSNNTFEGTAADVANIAKGEVQGNAFYFEYILKLPVGDNVYDVKFVDWMFLLDKKTLLARSYMSKFNIDLGEVTIIMINKDIK
jgi:hypothetical protein